MDKNLEKMREERTDQIKKEILGAIEAYNKSVKKKKKRYEDSMRGLTHALGYFVSDDNDEEGTEDDS